MQEELAVLDERPVAGEVAGHVGAQVRVAADHVAQPAGERPARARAGVERGALDGRPDRDLEPRLERRPAAQHRDRPLHLVGDALDAAVVERVAQVQAQLEVVVGARIGRQVGASQAR